MKQIESQLLGVLNQDENYEGTWHSSLINIPVLDNTGIPIIFEFDPNQDSEFLADAEKDLKTFFGLGINAKNRISIFLFAELKDFAMSAEDWLLPQHKRILEKEKVDKVWNCINPFNITAWRDHTNRIRIDIHCSSWDQEHGLEIEIVEGSKLTGTLVSIFNEEEIDLTQEIP